MNFQLRLLAAFLLVALINISVNVAAILEIEEASSETAQLYDKVVLPLDDLLTITESFHRIRVNLRDLADATTPADREAAEKTLTDLQTREAKAAADFGERLLTDQGRQLYVQYAAARVVYADDLRHMTGFFLSGKDKEGREYMTGPGKAHALAVQDILTKLSQSKTNIARENAGQRVLALWTFGSVTLAAVILSLLLALVLSRAVARAVRASVTGLEALSEHRWPDLQERMLNRSDELGQLIRAVRGFAQTWTYSQEAIRGASNRLRVAGLELDQFTTDTEAVGMKLRQDISAITSAVQVQSGAVLRLAAGSNTALQASERLDRSLSEEAAVQRALGRNLSESLVLVRSLGESMGTPADAVTLAALAKTLQIQLESLERQTQTSHQAVEKLKAESMELSKATRAIDVEMVQLLSASQKIETSSVSLEELSFHFTDSMAISRQAVAEAKDLAADLASLVPAVGPAGDEPVI